MIGYTDASSFRFVLSMISLHLTTTLLGVVLAGSILALVRRDHLHLSHGLFWMLIAFGALVLGMTPSLIDSLARIAKVSYSPTLLLLLAVIVLLLKALSADIALTRTERKLRRLNQRIALLEVERFDRPPRS